MEAKETVVKKTKPKKPKIERINFDDLIGQLIDEKAKTGWGKDKLTIVGGYCSQADLQAFLKAWQVVERQLNYALWETVSDSCLTDTDSVLKLTGFPQAEDLEYARFFGEADDGQKGGDLTLRRNENGFQWWFIGPAKAKVPSNYGAESFWATGEPNTKLHRHQESALLWGKYDDQVGRWYEDRVARAELAYPGLSGTPERVQLNYWSFTSNGQVAFVWLRNLEGYDG